MCKSFDILVVDDTADNLEFLRQILESEGLSVVCAVSAEDALTKMVDNIYRIMLTDLHMPGLDGIALAEKVSATAPQMQVFLMTGDISSDIPRLAREAGIRTVLNKPFRPVELLKAIRDGISPRIPDCCGAS